MLSSTLAVLIAALAVMSACAAAADPRLYAIDCGRADFFRCTKPRIFHHNGLLQAKQTRMSRELPTAAAHAYNLC